MRLSSQASQTPNFVKSNNKFPRRYFWLRVKLLYRISRKFQPPRSFSAEIILFRNKLLVGDTFNQKLKVKESTMKVYFEKLKIILVSFSFNFSVLQICKHENIYYAKKTFKLYRFDKSLRKNNPPSRELFCSNKFFPDKLSRSQTSPPSPWLRKIELHKLCDSN